MSTDRENAVARLLEGIEGLTVEQINELASKAELVSGWQGAMERAAQRAKTGRQKRRAATDEMMYQDLVAFCGEIGVRVEVASIAWNRLFGLRRGMSQSRVSELRRTPVTVGKVREYASRAAAHCLQPTLRQDEQLVIAWEKTL